MKNDPSTGKMIPNPIASETFDTMGDLKDVAKENFLQHSAPGKADWTRERKFRNRLHNTNTKYLKPYLKG
jgi:hypothetical protein